MRSLQKINASIPLLSCDSWRCTALMWMWNFAQDVLGGCTEREKERAALREKVSHINKSYKTKTHGDLSPAHACQFIPCLFYKKRIRLAYRNRNKVFVPYSTGTGVIKPANPCACQSQWQKTNPTQLSTTELRTIRHTHTYHLTPGMRCERASQ